MAAVSGRNMAVLCLPEGRRWRQAQSGPDWRLVGRINLIAGGLIEAAAVAAAAARKRNIIMGHFIRRFSSE